MAEKEFQIASRLRTLTSEMRLLERDLKSGTISDDAALQEFRHALDEVRMTSWTASELHHAQPGRKELLASFLAAERIRRFAQMMRDLSLDMEQEDVRWESGGIQTLYDAVTLLQSRSTASSATIAPTFAISRTSSADLAKYRFRHRRLVCHALMAGRQTLQRGINPALLVRDVCQL